MILKTQNGEEYLVVSRINLLVILIVQLVILLTSEEEGRYNLDQYENVKARKIILFIFY